MLFYAPGLDPRQEEPLGANEHSPEWGGPIVLRAPLPQRGPEQPGLVVGALLGGLPLSPPELQGKQPLPTVMTWTVPALSAYPPP